MSNPFKSIGKVFKKVVKSTVGKIIIGALMVGAVVLTAGAALGALPAIGSVLGSVGISGTMASVLGGAISMGAVGAVTGGLGAALSGKSIFSGAAGGFLMGAATGGILGGVGAIGPNGVFGSMGQGASGGAVTGTTAGSDIVVNSAANSAGVANAFNPLGTAAQVGAAVPTSVATSATTTATAAGAAQAAGHGLLGSAGIGPLIQGAGSIISGFAAGKASEAQMKADAQAQRDRYDRIAYNYGYRNIYDDKKSNLPSSQEQWYQYQPTPFLEAEAAPAGGLLRTTPSPFIDPGTPPPTQYQIVNGQVVPVARGA